MDNQCWRGMLQSKLQDIAAQKSFECHSTQQVTSVSDSRSKGSYGFAVRKCSHFEFANCFEARSQ